MKSLLKTTKEVEKKSFQGKELRTNLSFLLKADDYADIGRKDPFLQQAIVDSMAEIEMHDLRVRKISVTRQGKTVKVWVQTEKGMRFKDKSGQLTKRVGRILASVQCWSCEEWTYELERFEPKQHKKKCALVLAHEIMES